MPNANTIELDLPANHTNLNILDVCITEMLAQVERMTNPGVIINDIRVAVQEAWNNIVDHAYANQADGRIHVKVALDTSRQHIIIEFHDSGASFDFDVANVTSPADPVNMEERGLGLFLLYTLMDEVNYMPNPHNNFWRLMKHLG